MKLRIFVVKNYVADQKILASGAFTFLVDPKGLGIDLERVYGKKDLGLKLFLAEMCPIEEFLWGDRSEGKGEPLLNTSTVQNLMAIRGLAPRILDIVVIKDPKRTYYAQVTEVVKGEKRGFSKEQFDLYKSLLDKYHIKFWGDTNPSNYIEGKLVDFGYYSFNSDLDPDKYEDLYRKDIIERVNHEAAYGSREESYQAVEELDIPSQRDMKHRVGLYKLDEEDLQGKSVIDLGSSSGTFCRYAARQGASRVVGIEMDKGLEDVQYDLCNYLGPQYWNIDFYTLDLNTRRTHNHEGVYKSLVELTGRENFDVVLFLSMVQHVGFPEYIGKFCKEFFILEGNIAQHAPQFIHLMGDNFNRVEQMGYTKDHMPRVVLKGRK